jgi:glutamyl-tRNA reductase
MRTVDAEVDRIMVDLHYSELKPTILQLQQAYMQPKEQELARLLKRLSYLDEGAQHEIRRAFDRLTNKLMHRPLASLRDESTHGVPEGLVQAVAQLFHLQS